MTPGELNCWRNKVKERDNWVCQECGETERLHAHHVKHRFTHPELSDNLDNGITLCELCHAKKHPYIPWMRMILERAKEACVVV